MKDIYPSYTLVFVIFNLLGWWFKGSVFFSWLWFILIAGIEILLSSLLLAITKQILKIVELK
jgi:hypothetical protein